MTSTDRSQESTITDVLLGDRRDITRARRIATIATLVTLLTALVLLVVGGAAFSVGNASAAPGQKSAADLVHEGELYFDLGSYLEALSCYREALELSANDVEAGRGASKASSALGRVDDAERYLQAVVDAGGSDEDVRELVTIKLQVGKTDEAKALADERKGALSGDEYSLVLAEMQVQAPRFTLEEGTYESYQLLDVAEKQPQTSVHYTLDGTTPTTLSPLFDAPLPITAPSTTFKAIAVSSLGYESEVVELQFKITKEPTVVAKRFELPADMFPEKGFNEDVFEYELASVTEFHAVGDHYSVIPFTGVAFYRDGFDFLGRYQDATIATGSANIDLIKYMPYLRSLTICYQKSFDLSLLKGKHHLEELSLIHDEITDIEALKEMDSLKNLSLAWNKISKVSSLSNLGNLEVLGLWGNAIEDVSTLKALSNLTCLDVSSNKVADISCVASMAGLRELWIANNKISDLSPVSGLTHLNKFIQEGNPGSNRGLPSDFIGLLSVTDYLEKGDE